MSFIGEIARAQGKLGDYPHVAAWIQRFQARPAYHRRIEKRWEVRLRAPLSDPERATDGPAIRSDLACLR